MDDPAAAMPNEIIVVVPFKKSGSVELAHSNEDVPRKSGGQA